MLAARQKAHVNNFMYTRISNASLMDKRNIRTRAHDAPLFKINIPKNEAYKRLIMYAGALQWNNLDKDTRNIASYDMFKSKQKLIMAMN